MWASFFSHKIFLFCFFSILFLNFLIIIQDCQNGMYQIVSSLRHTQPNQIPLKFLVDIMSQVQPLIKIPIRVGGTWSDMSGAASSHGTWSLKSRGSLEIQASWRCSRSTESLRNNLNQRDIRERHCFCILSSH